MKLAAALALRTRKTGGRTLRSIGHAARLPRTAGNAVDYVEAQDRRGALCEDRKAIVTALCQVPAMCGPYGGVAAAGLVANRIEAAGRRARFLSEATRRR